MALTKKVFAKPMTDIITERISVRTYNPKGLTETVRNDLIEYGKTIIPPFQSKIRFEIIENDGIADSTKGKIGTYGVIKGSKYYIAAVVENGEKNLEDIGYTLEQLILYATSKGLGTCWLGGTFTKSSFERMVQLKEHEILPIITPVGYPAENKSLIERMMRYLANSKNRKPWEELFFNQDVQSPLIQEEASSYKDVLEMVRLAPSASNKQPWRVVKVDNQWHFYLAHNRTYSKAMRYNLQRIDLGIAMCHFELTASELGLQGSWQIQSNYPSVNSMDWEYIATWQG
ncbi:nitroreductase [Desulfuribacillus stibiiarsenatis]|uniref:Nitroreductase n=1 Tax=Desulfuribacillus stibiiarsenatis TaxID=1390249 RepID=A0A1E5L9S5_9FIRM|nr:nitroreductase family protein [Desulfuribacillus stibiiarsenatis]OEH86891.1 nitroreductase [Desulfuribacillus stibiiarsenatis]